MQRKTINSARGMAATIIALAAATTTHAQELLVNGDFEQGGLNTPGAPNWTTYNFTFTSGEFAHTQGGKAFKAYGPFFQVGAGSVGLQSAAATPGNAYTLTGYMFSPTTDHVNGANFGILELHFLDSSNAVIPNSGQQAQITASSPADTWIPYAITLTAPVGAVAAEVVIGHIQINNPFTGGAVYWDDLSLTQAIVASQSNWIATGSGGWLSASNWQDGLVPNAVGAIANFGTSITAASTVTIAGAGVTAGTVRFNNAANAYTIAGPGALTLDVATGTAALTVTAGSHAINAPLVVNDTTVATVAAGQTLTIGGALTLNGGSQLSATGGGTLRINATSVTGSTGATLRANGGTLQADVDLGTGIDVAADVGEARLNATQHVRSLTVAAGAKASLPDTATAHLVRTASLTVTSGGTLELGDNALVLDYTTASPAAAVRAAITAGQAGNFAGTGFASTKAAGDSRYSIGYAEASAVNSPTTFLGEAGIDATTVLVRVTLKGDADLNGTVNFSDLLALAQNYGGSNKVWSDGDFDYSGDVAFADLLSLSQNYGGTALSQGQIAQAFGPTFAGDWALAQSLVPEPTTLAACAGGLTLLKRRRR